MKKYLFPSLAVLLGMGLTLTSCSSDDETVGAANNSNAIGFVALTNNAAGTRGTAITTSNVNTTDFLAWGAFANGTYYFGTQANGIQFKYTDSKWDYANAADVHYWPTDALNFYAVSPSSAITEKTLSGTTLTFTVPEDNASQVDLMQAYAGGLTKTSDGVSDGKALLTFHHLLSQIVFKAKSASNTLNVEIQGIKIHNVAPIGQTDISKKDAALNVLSATTGAYDYAVGLKNPVSVPYGESTGTAVDATDADGALLLVPQTLTKWNYKGTESTTKEADGNMQSYIEVDVKIKSGDTYLIGSADAYAPTYIPFGATWEAGKKYTYTLVFGDKDSDNGGGGLDENGDEQLVPIGFNVEVTDWTDVDNEDITM